MKEPPSVLLLHRIQAESGLPVPLGTEIVRTYAGRIQRECGACLWFAVAPDGHEVCGSQYPITTLLSAKAIEVAFDEATGLISVDPIGA